MTPTTDLPDGYYMVPPGKLANAVVWLEMRARPATPLAEPLRLTPVGERERERCHGLFAAIGTPWLWNAAIDPAPGEEPWDTFLAQDDAGLDIGIVEFAGRDGREVEITYFGLAPSAIGQGLGRRLMAAALDCAWTAADRVWLHTCNFDHPGALRFYVSCGFVPFATGFEIMPDPRLDGALPADAAPHVPFIAPR